MRITTILFASTFAAFLACGSSNESNPEKSGENNNSNDDTTKVESIKEDVVANDEMPPQVEYDTYKTDVAKLIAGLPMDGNDSLLSAIASKDYYKEYAKFTAKTFGKVKESMLTPVKTWVKEKGMLDTRQDATCFYPLSGPDFMFGNTFYPYAQNYILMGLERRGTFPDFTKMSEKHLQVYFAGLKKSMLYINSRGYFVTQHMSRDFSRSHLDGVTHMIMYMMAHTDHKIIDCYPAYLGNDGKPVRINGKAPANTIEIKVIEFTDAAQSIKKSAYYISYDVSDTGMKKKPELEKFLRSFNNRMAYMKSASCVLFNTDFSIMRDLVLTCDKVIQDDTGVPYKYFTDDKFDVKLYGTYTTVIKDLAWCIQPKMREDIKTKGENVDLPFKISYNGNYGKGMILYAVNKSKK